MAEYNVQINKYNANNLGYDQLYPQPMKHADTHLLNGSDPINVGELGVSNRNILDNWYFPNPVDQRGGYVVPPDTPYYSDTGLTTQAGTVSAYTTAKPGNSTYGTITVSGTTYYVAWSAAVRGYTGAGYGIDRWFQVNANCLCTITDNGLVFATTSENCWMKQIIDSPDALFGRKVTVSMLTSDNTLHSITGTLTTASVTSNTGWDSGGAVNVGLYKTANGSAFVQIGNLTGNSITIKAVKLELGDQQTLAHQDENGNWVLNEIPDYGEQLARCQRFYEKFLFCNGEAASPVGVRIRNDTSNDADLVTIGAYIYFATQKRTVPVVRIEYDIADGPTQTATVNWVDERCFSSTNIIVPAGQFIDIHWYEAIADL